MEVNEIIIAAQENLPQHAEIRTPTGRIIKYLRKNEIHRMIQASKGRDRLLIETLWNTGARVSEVLMLTPSDFDFKEKVVTIRTKKKRSPKTEKIKALRVEIKGLELALGKDPSSKILKRKIERARAELQSLEETEKKEVESYRTIPINEKFATTVASYCYKYNLRPDQRIFPITRVRAHQIIREAGARAGIDPDRCHPHAFRHGYAVNAVLSGVPPLVLRRWLGHSKIDSTLVYTEALAQDTKGYLERMEF